MLLARGRSAGSALPGRRGRAVRILYRYILKEMLKAFALALAGVTGVVAFGLVLSALQSEGLSPLSSLLYMALSLPGAVYLALALSAVLAATLVYGRLAADNEAMAAQASGIPLSSLFWPSMVLAILAFGASLALAAWPLPESTYVAKRVGLRDIEAHFYSVLLNGKKISVRQPGGEGFQLIVDRVVGDMLYGPTLKYRSKREQMYCYAPYGRVAFDTKAHRADLTLWNAVIFDEKGQSLVQNRDDVVSLPLPSNLPRKEDELSLWQLVFVQRHPEKSEQFLAAPEDAGDEAKDREMEKIRGRALAEFHARLATAVGCFGLVLIGAGLGALFHSGHLLTAFGVALVPYMAATFLTMPAAKVVAKDASALPLLWIPNGSMVVLGALVLAYLAWGWPIGAAWRRFWRGGRR